MNEEQEMEDLSKVSAAVGTGGTLTYDLVQHYAATFEVPLLRCLAGAVAVAIPTLVAPSAAGAVLILKGKPEQRQTAQWVHESALQAYAPISPPGAPWKDQVLRVKELFQLTVGDLARFAAVERQTVYHWLAGAQPRPGKQRRIDLLESLARLWSSYGLGPARAYLTRPVGTSNVTLESLLTSEELDRESIAAHIAGLARLGHEVVPVKASLSQRLAARGFKHASDADNRKQRSRFVRSNSSGEE